MELDVVGLLETDLHVSGLTAQELCTVLILIQRVVYGNRDL